MNIHFKHLELICRQSVEHVDFAKQVTFIHGPVGTGKSSIARLVGFCLGADLTKTTALRSELLSAQLSATIGDYDVLLERELEQNSSVRVTWEKGHDDIGSIIAPLEEGDAPILSDDVFSLSDLLFKFSGVAPIRVRKSKADPDSELVRLSFRDVLWYCYLRQEQLDSSFFQMDHPFKRNKSIDVMRFIVGFHSDRLNELEQELVRMQDQLRVNRAAANQIREFLRRFQLGSDVGIDVEISQVNTDIAAAQQRREQIEAKALDATHTVDPLRERLRRLSRKLGREEESLADLQERVSSQIALRADFVSAKVKTGRTTVAHSILTGVVFSRCPQCGSSVEQARFSSPDACNLCGQQVQDQTKSVAQETEILRQDLNTRIDELDSLVQHHEEARQNQESRVATLRSARRRWIES